jgi:D-erythronate 2-dehydrogenase
MRIIVTGAGGFVGRKLVAQLADRDPNHRIVALDYIADSIPDRPHITPISGDLRDTSVLNTAFADGCDAVVHLATVPGGAAEKNPDIARQVNIDAMMALADIAAESGSNPRFVFASSIAALGDPLPEGINDNTPLAPRMLYGAHKAMMEQWLATLTRRGALDAISLRLSGVVARPKGLSGMSSAFLSNIFHALRAGESFVMPVSEDATSWLTSIDNAAGNFAHALFADLEGAPISRAVTLPTLRVKIGDLVSEIAAQVGQSIDSVRYVPDAKLETGFGRFPPPSTDASCALGFVCDSDLPSLVRGALGNIITQRI